MIDQACRDFDIDLENSWIVGDKALDVRTGLNAGISAALVMTGYGRDHREEIENRADVLGENLLDVVRKIISLQPSTLPLLAEDAP
jgi:D-glycero-D-manno-heptose 1,7-bisphosphate phosphatase